MMRRVLGSLGALVGLGSLLFLVIFIAEIFGFGDGKTEMPVLIGLALFFGGTTACGAWLARWGFTDPPSPDAAPSDRAAQIRLILNLAKQSGGDVTHLQVATETSLSLEQSRKLLDELVNEGLAQMEVDDNAVMLYVFPDLRPAGRSLPEAHEREL